MKERLLARRLAIWPTLPLGVHFRKINNWRPFPLNQEGCRVFSLARHAIWNACNALGLKQGDVILVPAYHHGSEIEALLQAGLSIRYFEVNENLEPDPLELEDLLGPEVRALYIIHYLGFPQDGVRWRKWCDERGLLLIEDAAQAFLATRDGHPVGSYGHMSLFCLYKTYGIPDGGAVVSVQPPALPTAKAQTGIWRMFKRHVNWVAARRGEVGGAHLLIKPIIARLKKLSERLHKEFELGDASSPPSTMTMPLLHKLLDEGTAKCRRENYMFLLRHLGELVPAPFAVLPDGACPFAFPLEVSDAKNFLQQLHRRGVVGLLFWLNPHPSLPVTDFPRSRKLREGVLALPVHQELTQSELEQIVDAVKETVSLVEQKQQPLQV